MIHNSLSEAPNLSWSPLINLPNPQSYRNPSEPAIDTPLFFDPYPAASFYVSKLACQLLFQISPCLPWGIEKVVEALSGRDGLKGVVIC